MITTNQIDGLLDRGGNVIDPQGEKIGSIGQIYVDDQNSEPTWVTVKTGFFGMNENFVPLKGASVQGDDIRVAYTKDQVKDALSIDPDGHLDASEEQRLYEYYDMGDDYVRHDDDRATFGGYREGDTTRDRTDYTDTNRTGGVDRTDTRRRDDDEAEMVLSEERAKVGTERHDAGRVRLRKHVVTENVTKTVPVQREEVRVERVPADGSEHVGKLGDDTAEVQLHEERPVVEKETVATEKVRLGKETVTDQETVQANVRKEEVDTEEISGRDRDRR